MNRRDDNLALRSLTAAVESNNETLRAHGELLSQVIGRLDTIDGHLGVLIDTVAAHIAEHHEGGET